MDLQEMLELAVKQGGKLTIDFGATEKDVLVQVTEPKNHSFIARLIDKETGKVDNTDYAKNFGSLEQKGAVTKESFADFLERVESSGVDAVMQDGENELSFAEVVDKYRIGVDPEKEKEKAENEIDVRQLPTDYQAVITEVYGYGLDEVRAFKKGMHLQITDLDLNDINAPQPFKKKADKQSFLDWFTLDTLEGLEDELTDSYNHWVPKNMGELLLVQWYVGDGAIDLNLVWGELFAEWTPEWIENVVKTVDTYLRKETILPTNIVNAVKDSLKATLDMVANPIDGQVWEQLEASSGKYIGGKTLVELLGHITSVSDFDTLDNRLLNDNFAIGRGGVSWITHAVLSIINSLREIVETVCVEIGSENLIPEKVIKDILADTTGTFGQYYLYPIAYAIVQNGVKDKEFMKPLLAQVEEQLAGVFVADIASKAVEEAQVADKVASTESAKVSTGEELNKTIREMGVVNAYKQGQTMVEIKKCYNLSSGAVYTILNKHGVQRKNQGTSKVALRVQHVESNQRKLAELFEDYEENGLTLGAIYEKYAIHKNGLYYLLDKYSIPRRG